jgi:hypothetical protein
VRDIFSKYGDVIYVYAEKCDKESSPWNNTDCYRFELEIRVYEHSITTREFNLFEEYENYEKHMTKVFDFAYDLLDEFKRYYPVLIDKDLSFEEFTIINSRLKLLYKFDNEKIEDTLNKNIIEPILSEKFGFGLVEVEFTHQSLDGWIDVKVLINKHNPIWDDLTLYIANQKFAGASLAYKNIPKDYFFNFVENKLEKEYKVPENIILDVLNNDSFAGDTYRHVYVIVRSEVSNFDIRPILTDLLKYVVEEGEMKSCNYSDLSYTYTNYPHDTREYMYGFYLILDPEEWIKSTMSYNLFEDNLI